MRPLLPCELKAPLFPHSDSRRFETVLQLALGVLSQAAEHGRSQPTRVTKVEQAARLLSATPHVIAHVPRIV
jgi:hypothetical protein